MGNVGRAAIVFVAALVVGACTYASASDLDRNGALGTIVFSTAAELGCLVIPVLAAACDRLHLSLPEDPYPTLVIMGTGFLLAIYSLGFLLRAAFDQVVSKRSVRRFRDKVS
ncbi:MAG TPA: hypothetical protein VFY04_08495 [Solirubrobacterales bacterium]|nr:hypothetical protein [Solirubrobacterales bacterium]